MNKSFSLFITAGCALESKSKVKIKQGKKSIKSGYKKAIITLKKGQSIDLTTGI